MTGLGSSCGACKFLRRKCTMGCVFAPYFSYEQAVAHFAAVHKVFGASNVSKLLLHLPVQSRSAAAITISYEALARMQDPIYGCIAHIFALQQQIASLQEEVEFLGHHVANITVAIASDGNPQTTPNPSYKIHIPLPEDAMINQYYQCQLGAHVHSACCTTESEAFDNRMNLQLAHSIELVDQNTFCDFQTSPSDILFEGFEQDIFPYCAWLDSGNNVY